MMLVLNMTRLAVQIKSESVPDVLNGGSGRSEISALLDEARAAGLSLLPMHPGTHDPELRTWFFAQTEKARRSCCPCEETASSQAVLSAYPKPSDELP